MPQGQNFIDMTGQTFARLEVVCRVDDRVEPSGQKKPTWLCRCECGNEVEVLGADLRSGNTKSCGCFNREATAQRFVHDLTGQVFGRLTVIERVANRGRRVAWHCRCECGAELATTATNLESGDTRSCGCLKREMSASRVGEKHPSWRGDRVEYSQAHRRIRRVKGSADEHPCVDCGESAKEWSYVGGCPREQISDDTASRGYAYSTDLNYYVARCKSCHSKHDNKRSAA